MASADMATRREEARRRQSGGARSGARSAASAGGSRGGLGEPTPVNSTTTSEDTRGRAASHAATRREFAPRASPARVGGAPPSVRRGFFDERRVEVKNESETESGAAVAPTKARARFADVVGAVAGAVTGQRKLEQDPIQPIVDGLQDGDVGTNHVGLGKPQDREKQRP